MTTTYRKPNVFIGCSREAIDYARAVSSHLEWKAQVNPWYAGTFGANDYTMEALERELDANDFGVFIFAAEDVAWIRKKLVFITRDNTLFEMGLFWGRLGRRRVFCIIPRDLSDRAENSEGLNASKFHLPSDLVGLTLLEYGLRDDGSILRRWMRLAGRSLKRSNGKACSKTLESSLLNNGHSLNGNKASCTSSGNILET
ncbi:TIR domain-containing protein [uncultured Paenibacillus sp.]|uniref:TIR domain-containing protein n=1 Tax=uncultured Paenibacillus sp. TaxID=227322 RepID=UPI0028D41A32|nr:TIR domain-containing protein [uncultured Paenibacillus sp.]